MKIARSLAVCLAACWPAAAFDEKPPARIYTNEDLDRVRQSRDQTGVASEPAAGPEGQKASVSPRRPATRGEEFWRRERERERQRLEPLRRRLSALEQRLAERRAKRGVQARTDPMVESTLAQMQALREHIREEESRFEDRARREGALPGWLR